MILIDDYIFKYCFDNYLKNYRKFSYILSDEYIFSLESDFKRFNLSLKDIDNLYSSICKRFSRAYKRIKYLFSNYNHVYFITLTFNDLNVIDFQKHFNYFKHKYLKQFCYIANIDYGSINNRVHYHLVLGSSFCLTKDNFIWKYGFYDIKRCFNNSKSISRYLIKLSYHSFKKTNRVIYSRINK